MDGNDEELKREDEPVNEPTDKSMEEPALKRAFVEAPSRRPPFDSSHRLNSSLTNFHLLIGVTGSVATIKILELIEEFRKKDTKSQMVIKVVATESSLNFFDDTRLENEGVTVYTDRDEWNVYKNRGDPVLHIELRKWADAFLIAPLDANTMAKIANGLCDNLLTCVARAWDFNSSKSFFFAPAMNTCMWENPCTADHLKKLKLILMCKEIPPIEKELICGDKGYGAMASIQMIASIVFAAVRDKFAIRSLLSIVMWIFGYGSLVWRPNFKYCELKTGVVKGYARRFWQLSPDHRGTEESPGRTVTLVEAEPSSICWGMAYKVPEEEVEATVNYLNIREQAGYELQSVEFHPDDGSDSFHLEVYISISSPENIYFEPSATIETIVDTIIHSHGKSGSNLEYALRLADIHRRYGSHVRDDHLFEIERRLLKVCEANRINDKVLHILGHKLSAATS